MGSARALIACVRAPSPVSSTVSTRVSSPPVSVTRTEMIENGVVAVSVAVRVGPFLLGRLLLTRRTSAWPVAIGGGGAAASSDAGIAGGRARTLASRATTAAVATTAGTARRTTARALTTRTPR